MRLRDATAARLWVITVLLIACIVYGSLYPFEFHPPPNGIGPVATLLASWPTRPGRSDLLANILLYLPLGFFLTYGCSRSMRGWICLPLTILAGGALSLTMELVQYYDADRVTAFSDLYANTLGTALGAFAARGFGSRVTIPFVAEGAAQPVPSLLLCAWLIYCFYPYVPAADLHKYWDALKPVVLTPSLAPYDLFHQTVVWITLYALIEAILGGRRSAKLGPLFAAGALAAKVLVVANVLRVVDIAGAGLGYLLWLGLLTLPVRLRMGLAGTLLTAYIVAHRLEPFTFQEATRAFGWLPFRALMKGSITVNTLSFLEKFFLYGGAIYLLGVACARLWPGAVLITGALFMTSWMEVYLPGRSAEITDATLALTAALVFALLAPAREGTDRQLRDWQRAQAHNLGIRLNS